MRSRSCDPGHGQNILSRSEDSANLRLVHNVSQEDRISSTTTRCESLLEAVPDALVGMDQKGVIRFVNSQTESLFNYDRDQLIGQPIDTLGRVPRMCESGPGRSEGCIPVMT